MNRNNKPPVDVALAMTRNALNVGAPLGALTGMLIVTLTVWREQWLSAGLHRLALDTAAMILGLTVLTAIATVAGLQSLRVFLASKGVKRAGWLLLSIFLIAPALKGMAAMALPGARLLHMQQEGSGLRQALVGLLESPLIVPAGIVVLLALASQLPYRLPSTKTGSRLHPSTFLILASCAALFAAVQVDRRANRPDGPDIVMIAIDTLRADHTEPYGYERSTTPVFASLAADSVVWDQTVSSAPWTTPALVAAHTGRYPGYFGLRDRPVQLPARAVLLAELLQNANYRTAAFVSNLFGSAAVGLDQGFDHFDDSEAQGHDYVSSKSLTNRAIRWLRSSPQRPVFLYIHYFDPHFEYQNHAGLDFDPEYGGRIRKGLHISRLRQMAPYLDAQDLDHLRALYDSEIAFTDQQIGRLIDELKRQERYDDSLVVYFGDHGEEFSERGQHWIGHTRTLFEEQLRVPVAVKYPGNQRAGTRVSAPTSLVDIAPTVAHAAGLIFPRPVDGVVEGQSDCNRAVFAETHRDARLRAIRKGPYKLIRDMDTSTQLFFDLRSDPEERNNLGFVPEAAVLAEELDRWVTTLPDAGQARKVIFSEDEKSQLEALGYLGN